MQGINWNRGAADLAGSFSQPKRLPLLPAWHFEAATIVLCVPPYFRHPLSNRKREEIMPESAPSVDHVTIWRWQTLLPKADVKKPRHYRGHNNYGNFAQSLSVRSLAWNVQHVVRHKWIVIGSPGENEF